MSLRQSGSGMSQAEVDQLSARVAELYERGEVYDQEIVQYVLAELPDSEHGQGQYNADLSSEVLR